MDPVRLRELIALMRKGIDTYLERKELLDADELLTCPEPLTLARAVEVVGREPDHGSGRFWSWHGGIHLTKNTHEDRVSILKVDVVYENIYLPTVGQFACMVLAAKQGVGG
jgi:hypothetical protein